MPTIHSHSIHLLVAIAMSGIAFVGCSSEKGGPGTITLPGEVELEMVTVPAGTFTMGSNNGLSRETPVHKVTLTQNFQLGRFEVTKAQWEAVMGTTPWAGQHFVLEDPDSDTKPDPDSAATHVSWNDAQAFISALNALTGQTFRLPTEAEWEYACRAGSTTAYYFGDSSATFSDYGWWGGNADNVGEDYAHVVGQLLPNAFGLYDMHGNVWEWCEDWYGLSYYSSSSGSNPQGPALDTKRVIRGGSWTIRASSCRSAMRAGFVPSGTTFGVGFRLAR